MSLGIRINKSTWMLGERFPADVSHIAPNSMELQFMSSESAAAIFRFIRPKADELFDFEHARIDFGVKLFDKVGFLTEIIGNGFGEFDADFHYDTVIRPKDFN